MRPDFPHEKIAYVTACPALRALRSGKEQDSRLRHEKLGGA